ncbi:MAG: hypothetical protein ACLT98_01500 [Eggerthellaceae bacterium]
MSDLDHHALDASCEYGCILRPEIKYCFVEADGKFMLFAHEMVEQLPRLPVGRTIVWSKPTASPFS